MSVESATKETLAWARRWGMERDVLVPILDRLRVAIAFTEQVGGQGIQVRFNEVPPDARRELVGIFERNKQP